MRIVLELIFFDMFLFSSFLDLPRSSSIDNRSDGRVSVMLLTLV